MLERIDRIQMVVPDREAAASGWIQLLGAEVQGEDRLACLAARRSRLRLGDGWVELLEPDGAGPVSDAVAERGAHLFAAGVTTSDVDGLRAHLESQGLRIEAEAGQLHLDAAATGGRGLRLVVSAEASEDPVGTIDTLYEVTNLVDDAKAAADDLAARFALESADFVPIDSRHYGYDGTLTLFDPDRLDRIEVITPRDPEKTMGRFFRRFGGSLYMAFAESGELAAIEERARERRAGFTVVPPPGERDALGAHTLFLHPPALGGMMLGLSRRRWAWTWSGHPERAGEGA